MDYGLNFGLGWTVASVLAVLFKADFRMPNEWRNGLTVGKSIICSFFGKDWMVAIGLLFRVS